MRYKIPNYDNVAYKAERGYWLWRRWVIKMTQKPLYEIFSGEEYKIAEKINRRRRQIKVHGRLYYEYDLNLISDHTYDAWGRELAELQDKYPDIAKQVPFAKEFEEFDGSTGFDIPKNDKSTIKACKMLLNAHGIKK